MKIALYDKTDSVTGKFFRGAGAFGPLSKVHRDVEFITDNPLSWEKIPGCDALIMFRPTSPSDVPFMERVRLFGVSIAADYDDDLANLPPYFRTVMSHQERSAVGRISEGADMLILSTPCLLRSFQAADKGVIIPNAWNERMFPFVPWHGRRGVISWRGGLSHNADLEMFAPAMLSVAGRHPEQQWMFIGAADAWRLAELPKMTRVSWFTDLLEYFQFFLNSKPFVHIVPLVPNLFNEGKSNISWLEATAAGALVVAPDFEEFRKPGVFNYSVGADAVTDFEEKLERALGCSDSEARVRVESSRDYINENLTLRKINEVRYTALRRLCQVSAHFTT